MVKLSKTFLFRTIQFSQTIQFSLSMQWVLFNSQGPIKCYHSILEPHHHVQDTHCDEKVNIEMNEK